MSIHIVTDSTAYLEKAYVEENNITVIPLSYHFLGEDEKEGYPGEFDQFFHKLENSKDFPKTSQPAIGEFIEIFERKLKEHKEIITILISAKLSGTYYTALQAAEMVDSSRITVIDSEMTASNLKVLVQKAKELASNGISRLEIAEIINNMKKRMGITLTVGSLEYLKRSGRLNNIEAFIGNLLNIKPIIGLVEGKLVSLAKVRGEKKAIEWLIEHIPDNVKKIHVNHILYLEQAENIYQQLKERFHDVEIEIDKIGPIIGSHLGPKSFGLIYYW